MHKLTLALLASFAAADGLAAETFTSDPDHTLPDADRSNNDFLLPARS